MDSRILQQIQSLASTSSEARQIADRLGISVASSYDLAQLQERLHDLERQIAFLHHELNNPQVPDWSDAMKSGLLNDMHKVFANAEITLDDLRGRYDTDFFKDIPQDVRDMVANLLINHFMQKKAQPEPLWVSLVTRHGVLIGAQHAG